MTKETQAMSMFEVLEAVYAFDGNPPDVAVVSVVRGYMLAFKQLGDEEVAPAKPKQRRARRKKSDIVVTEAGVA